MFQRLHKKFTLSSVILFFVVIFGGWGIQVEAASLSFSPLTKTVSTGNILSVKVVVNTEGRYINNTEGTVQFPADLLEVISVNKQSSIFTLWVEEPSYSNSQGKISFNGGLPTPGYSGGAGEVVSITFRAKKAGTASLVYVDSSVRENDGYGTDILTSKQTASFTIENAVETEVPVVPAQGLSLPLKPTILSSTHPDQNIWYSGTTASFSWNIPSGITSIQTLLGKNANSIPTVSYDSSVSQRTVNNLTDGVLYFHLRYMNSSGWGPTAHYKIQVDSTIPEPFTPRVRASGNQSIVMLNALDLTSGIDSYILQIDDQTPFRVKPEMLVNSEYILPVQIQGEHILSVQAFDKAQNSRETHISYTSGHIVPPSIELSSTEATKGDVVHVYGKSQYPDTKVMVFVQQENKEPTAYITTTNADGTFSVETTALPARGLYKVWAQLVFSDRVKSEISEQLFLKVIDTPFARTTTTITYSLSMIIPILALIIIILLLIYTGWHKFFGLKRRISRDVDDVVSDTHKAMKMFKDELAKQLQILEKAKVDKGLNRKEEKVFKELQNNIDSIDDFIEKKLKKIK